MKNVNKATLGGIAMLAGISGATAQDTAPLFRIGSVDVRPHAQYSLMYDDNIFLENKQHTAGKGNAGRDHDWIQTITPGLRLNAGDAAARQTAYFDANYEAAIIRFTNYKGSDAVDHNARVELGGKLNFLSLKVDQTLMSASDADQHSLTANGRVKRKLWGTKADVGYEISEKTSATLELKQDLNDYAAPLVNSVDRSATLWLDYQVLPKVRMGAGVGGGYLQVDDSAASFNPNSVYGNGQLRFDWFATEKVTVKASGGVEDRHYQGVPLTKDSLNFIFTLGADWKAGELTTVGLSGTRGSKASNANGNVINEETAVNLGVRHRLMDNLSFNMDSGYSFSHYKATSLVGLAPGALRDDNYWFLKPSLSYRFLERAQATAFYQYRRNDSNLPANGNDFYGTQVGLELSYRF